MKKEKEKEREREQQKIFPASFIAFGLKLLPNRKNK